MFQIGITIKGIIFNKGVPPEKRQKVRSLRPICEYSHDGDQYKVSGSAEGFPERSKNFVLNVEQEETTMDGRKVKVRINKIVCPFSLLNFPFIYKTEHVQAQRQEYDPNGSPGKRIDDRLRS